MWDETARLVSFHANHTIQRSHWPEGQRYESFGEISAAPDIVITPRT